MTGELAGRARERQRAARRWGAGAQPPSMDGERVLGLPREPR
jgi:hypothetical protein